MATTTFLSRLLAVGLASALAPHLSACASPPDAEAPTSRPATSELQMDPHLATSTEGVINAIAVLEARLVEEPRGSRRGFPLEQMAEVEWRLSQLIDVLKHPDKTAATTTSKRGSLPAPIGPVRIDARRPQMPPVAERERFLSETHLPTELPGEAVAQTSAVASTPAISRNSTLSAAELRRTAQNLLAELRKAELTLRRDDQAPWQADELLQQLRAFRGNLASPGGSATTASSADPSTGDRVHRRDASD